MEPHDAPFLSIVIPAFNEERRLPDTLRALIAHCEKYPFGWEIVVVVERSTDNTVAAAAAVAAQSPEISVIVNQVRRGKGYAVRTGIGLSRGQIVFSMDADLSVPPDYLDSFLSVFESDSEVDVLVGNRRHPDSVIAVRQSKLREWLGRRFNTVLRLLAATELGDTQCGFKAMRREAAIEVYSRQTYDGFACDVEVLMLAERMGFKVRDQPVRWINSPDSRVRLIRDSLHMLWDALWVRFRVWRTLARQPLRRSLEN